MSRDMNEFIRIIKMPIGNVLQMIVFFYCENDERSFRGWYYSKFMNSNITKTPLPAHPSPDE